MVLHDQRHGRRRILQREGSGPVCRVVDSGELIAVPDLYRDHDPAPRSPSRFVRTRFLAEKHVVHACLVSLSATCQRHHWRLFAISSIAGSA